jgi:hypothetical protein
LKKSEIRLGVLAIISKKSKERNRTIAAISLREIKEGLSKYYNKDLTERHILNVIRDLEKIVVKEKDPRNHRRTLYRINPTFTEEVTLTFIKLNNEKLHTNNLLKGLLCVPLLSVEKKKFLVIDREH